MRCICSNAYIDRASNQRTNPTNSSQNAPGNSNKSKELKELKELKTKLQALKSTANGQPSGFRDHCAIKLDSIATSILKGIANLPSAKGHLEILVKCTNKKRYADFEPFPTAQIEKLKNELQAYKAILTTFKTNVTVLTANVQKVVNQGTNSTGVKKINDILHSPEMSSIDQLEAIVAIAKARRSGMRNTVSNWSIFGKGRHQNVNKLYDNIQALPEGCKTDDCLATTKLEELSSFISKTSLVHSR